jgi:FtsP/CotA-like multicopper oxidase with cupredoxin domain
MTYSHPPTRQGRSLRRRWFVLVCTIALLGSIAGLARFPFSDAVQALPILSGFDTAAPGYSAAGTTRTVQHTLANETALPQTFDLAAESSENFAVAVNPTTVALAAGASAAVELTITVPADSPPGSLDVTILTATNRPPAPRLVITVRDATLVRGEANLKIPAAQYGQLTGGKRIYDLNMASSSTEFWPGINTPTSGYNGSFLGPTLIMTETETVQVNVTNNLTETTTTHWHGMHLPGEMDGGPHQGFEPGVTWRPTWEVRNPASTVWYHPHPHPHESHHGESSGGSTGSQVYSGLAGMILIRDSASNGLGLPSRYGVDQFPLVLQDRRFKEDGSFYAEPNEKGHRKGDAFMVNGTLAGQLAAPAQYVRLHLLNGSNFRFYNLGLSDNRSFLQIASDNALLNSPVERTRLHLGPGERAEIVVDLSDAQGQTLHMVTYNAELGDTLVPNHTADTFDRANFILFTINVGAPTAQPVTFIPTTLNTITRLERSQATVEHRLVLNIPPSLNGTTFAMETINITSTLDTVEIWSMINLSDEPHPLHIHGMPFQILLRAAPIPIEGEPLPPGGVAPPAYELGWKDTVIVYPGERVDVIRRVYDFADLDAPFMYHCHLLEHEDKGMMGQFVVREANRPVYAPMVSR